MKNNKAFYFKSAEILYVKIIDKLDFKFSDDSIYHTCEIIKQVYKVGTIPRTIGKKIMIGDDYLISNEHEIIKKIFEVING